MTPTLRRLVLSAPWAALAAWSASRMLWFLQQSWHSRLAAWMACCACSAVVAWRFRSPGQGDRSLTIVALAGVLAALGLQGATSGLSATGVVTSLGLSASAVLLWDARFGGRPAAIKAVALVLATALPVAAAESMVRMLKIAHTARETDSRELARQFNNLTPPGTAYLNSPSALDEFPPAMIEINSAGTRGPEIAREKVDLLVIGDSFVEARQLPWEDTIGPRLQAALQRDRPGVRVLAHGMRGWSPLLEWNWYLKVGRRFQPRVVLLFFFWNDLWTAGTEVRSFRAVLDERGRPDYFDAQVDPAWMWYKPLRVVRITDEVVRLARASGVRRLFRGAATPAGVLDDGSAAARARQLAVEPPFSESDLQSVLQDPFDRLSPGLRQAVSVGFWPGMRPLDRWSPDQVEAARHTERELAAFAADVAADHARLVIVYVPNPLQVGSRECSVGRFMDRVGADVVLPPDSGVQHWLRDTAARHGIELLDPTGDLRRSASAGDGPFYLRADCHWSRAGHQFMADWITRWYARVEGP